MDKNISTELEKVIDKIKIITSPKKIILFGSYAKGNANEYSDIDLCIITEEKRKKLEIIWDIREAIFEETSHSYDLLVYSNLEFENNLDSFTSIESQINTQGVILYEQN